jgi:threonine 3-dehydrogenase
MPNQMTAVIKPGPVPGLEITRRPVPKIGPDDVLVRVKAASICGTDLHIYRWDAWSQRRLRPPLIVGHEFCGEVVARGKNVTTVSVGDFISAESHVVDNTCFYCRTGQGHICQNTRIIGVDRDGAFAEFIAIPAQNAWVNPPDMPLEIAVLQENFGNAVHTAFAADLSAKKVLVTGCGPVGVMTIAVARARGARSIFATDIYPYRLRLAKKMGADATINPKKDDVVKTIFGLTDGEGVDVLLEMSGAPSAIAQGFQVLKYGGEAALLGLAPGPITFDINEAIVFKGAKVYGIVGRRLWETWYRTRGLLRSGDVDLRPLVTHRFKLSEYEQAFETMAGGNSGKVVLFPD